MRIFKFGLAVIFCYVLHTPISVSCASDSKKTVLMYKKDIQPYVSFLKKEHQEPKDYVLSLFDRYDVVVLCERHHYETTQYELIFDIVSDPRFIKDVGHIFTETGTSSIRSAVREYLHSEDLVDERAEERLLSLCRDLDMFPVRAQYNMYDFLKKIRELNRSLPEDQKVNLYPSGMPFRWEDMTKDKLQQFHRQLDSRDRIMAQQIIQKYNELLKAGNKRKKSLVIMNFRHAFNDCQFAGGGKGASTGRYLFEAYPGKVANVIINQMALLPRSTTGQNIYGAVQDGKWDAPFAVLGNPNIGFDLERTPFGRDYFDFRFVDNKWFREHNLTYQDVFTGFVFYKPLEQHRVAFGIPGLLDNGFIDVVMERWKISGETISEEFRRDTERYNQLSVLTYAEASTPMADVFERINQWKEANRPTPIDVHDVKDANCAPYLLYLKEKAKPPVEYVRGKFQKHDVVILGEMHEVKEYLELVRDLIEPLYYKARVRCFAMETLKSKHNALTNKLVTDKEYDQQLALRLFRDAFWPFWGFKEYMDITKAVWEVNRKLPPQAERFRVVGLEQDWDAYDMFFGSGEKPAEERDEHMAKVFAQEVLEKGEKALVLIGFNHSFTHYRQPIVKEGKLVREWPRFGYILHEKYGDRIFQICLHQRHAGFETLTGGKGEPDPILIDFIEEMLEQAGKKAAGFDIQNSPFANLRDRQSNYFHFQKEVVFSDVARGYIFLEPLEDLNKITWVEGFIEESNFEIARKVAEKRGWIKEFEKKGLIKPGECDTPEGLDKLFKLLFESP